MTLSKNIAVVRREIVPVLGALVWLTGALLLGIYWLLRGLALWLVRLPNRVVHGALVATALIRELPKDVVVYAKVITILGLVMGLGSLIRAWAACKKVVRSLAHSLVRRLIALLFTPFKLARKLFRLFRKKLFKKGRMKPETNPAPIALQIPS